MAEKVKIVGGTLDGSQLENAASEATLLLVKEAMNKLANIKNVAANKSTRDITRLGDSAEGAADEIDNLGGAFSMLGGPLKLVTGGFKLLFGGLGALLGAVDAGANSLIKFSSNMINSQPNITDFTEAIAESKLNILGLGTALDAATKILYGNYTTFQELSKSGYQLGSQVSQLTGDITANRLTMQEFSQIASENSENFAMFGNSTVGLNKFLKMNSAAFKMNREVLQNWGVTFSEQGELFAEFLGQNAYAMRKGTRTQAEVTALSADYATTLLKISGLTGKTLKQMQEDMGKQNLNNAFKSFLDSLPADEAAKVNAMILAQQEQFGDDAADLAMAQAMGMAPMTTASQQMAALVPDLVSNIGSQLQAAKDSKTSLDTYSTSILDQNQKVAAQNEPLMRSYRDVAFALSMKGDSLGDTMQTMIGYFRKTATATDAMNVALDPTATAIATFDTVVSNLRATMGGWFTDFFNNPDVQAGLTKMTDWLKNFDPTKYNPFNEEGRRNLMYSWEKMMGNIGTMLTNFWNGENGVALRNTIAGFFQGFIVDLLEWLHETTGFFTDTLAKAKQGQAGYLSDAERIQADTATDKSTLSDAQRSYLDVKAQLATLQANSTQLQQDMIAAKAEQDKSYGRARQAADFKYKNAFDASRANSLEIQRLQGLVAGSIQTKPPEEYQSMGIGDQAQRGFANGSAGFENFGTGTQAVLHNTEAVIPRNTLAGDLLNKSFGNDWNKLTGVAPVTNEQQKQSAQSQDNTGKYIMQLNNTMLLVLEELRKSNNLEKRTLNSVKGLSGDMFRGM